MNYDSVAQRIERGTSKPTVAGSIPAAVSTICSCGHPMADHDDGGFCLFACECNGWKSVMVSPYDL